MQLLCQSLANLEPYIVYELIHPRHMHVRPFGRLLTYTDRLLISVTVHYDWYLQLFLLGITIALNQKLCLGS